VVSELILWIGEIPLECTCSRTRLALYLLCFGTPSICYVSEITSKHIGIGVDLAKLATWRVRGSNSANY
jgi:hypothetical protein